MRMFRLKKSLCVMHTGAPSACAKAATRSAFCGKLVITRHLNRPQLAQKRVVALPLFVEVDVPARRAPLS